MSTQKRLFASGSIQSRLLTIALVPSIAALLIGVAVSGYLINYGLAVSSYAGKLEKASDVTTRFVSNVQTERRLTLGWISDRRQSREPMDKARQQTDQTLSEMDTLTQELEDGAPPEAVTNIDELRRKMTEVRDLRGDVNSGGSDIDAVYGFYNGLVESFSMAMRSFARSAPEATMAYEQVMAVDLIEAADAMSRGHALATARTTTGMNPTQFHEYIHQIGAFHDNLNSLRPRMTPEERANYKAISKGPAWIRLNSIQDALEQAGGQSNANQVIKLPVSLADWQAAAGDLAGQLDGLYQQHSVYAVAIGNAQASTTLYSSIAGGVIVLLLALVVFAIAYRLSQLLIRRLTRLRQETLNLSDVELPAVVERLRRGERVDVESEVAWLDHGDDEIGQVADAFNRAQHTAIAATVQEAETRQGVRSVFLNIAHRSQVMVHRQLKVLDQAQRSQEDPDQLELLFQLDHLATQSRRNAENLIILGGQRPGRQWRKPVTLLEVVRGAIAETEQYARVELGKLPELELQGMVVADLIHLLAELVDNATSFSPPESHVEVHGNIVGRGIVIEIEDQGLGIEPEPLEELNAMLSTPPDFSVMALSAESRMGLFVVAQLAARHDIKITLRDSPYGGIRALVLVPSTLIADREEPEPAAAGRVPKPQAAPERSEARQETPPAPTLSGHIYNEVTQQTPIVSRLGGESPAPAEHNSPKPTSTPIANELTKTNNGTGNVGSLDGRSARTPQPPPLPSRSAGSTRLPGASDQTRPAMQYLGQQQGESRHAQSPANEATFAEPGLLDKRSQASRPDLARPETSRPEPLRQEPQVSAPPNGGDKPALPKRRRQANLAAPLREEPTQQSQESESKSQPSQPRTPDRSRVTMAAFQKGTRRARTSDADATPGTPRQRGDEG